MIFQSSLKKQTTSIKFIILTLTSEQYSDEMECWKLMMDLKEMFLFAIGLLIILLINSRSVVLSLPIVDSLNPIADNLQIMYNHW